MKGQAAEPGVRVLLAFFAALVGFGLKALLDKPFPEAGLLAFLTAVFLVVRFIVGAANHLWYEYSRQPGSEIAKAAYARDLAFLIVFGVLAALMCYSKSGAAFLGWAAAIPFSALVWGLMDRVSQKWQFWRTLNAVHLLALLAALAALELPRHGVGPLVLFGWSPSRMYAWWFVLLVGVAILCWDFWQQLDAMHDA